jgi:hypothetical protein
MIKFKTDSNTIAVVSIVILVFMFLAGSRTLTSGFHFVDDHEVIKMKSELKSLSAVEVSRNWIKTDISSNGRFRPMYYFHRVLETSVFGSDFLLWSVYTAILCCISMIGFFLGMRNLKFSIPDSVVLLLAVFIGPQSSVWWRLGPQESLGMVFLGLAFYFMSNSFGKKSYNMSNLLFILFLILSSLTKESFILIIPAMLLLRIWYEKTFFGFTIKQVLNRNLILLVPLIVALVELFYIKFHVGTAYAGIGDRTSETIQKVLSTSLHFIRSFLLLFILILFVLPFVYWFNSKNRKKSDLFPVIFFLILVLPNIILYSGSGMFERYLLPASLGVGFLVASALMAMETDQFRIKKTVTILAIISFLPLLIGALSDAVEFSKDGRDTNRLLNALGQEKNNGETTLLVADPVFSYEISVSLKTYLIYEKDTDLFGYCLINEKDSTGSKSYVDGWKYYFDGRQLSDMQSTPGSLIFLDKTLVERFFGISGLLKQEYEKVEIGDSVYALYRNKSLD